MYEIRIKVDIPGLPEAITSLANALSNRAFPVSCTESPLSASVSGEEKVEQTCPVETASFQNASTTAANETINTSAEAEPPSHESAKEKEFTIEEIGRAGAALIELGKMQQLIDLLKIKYCVQTIMDLKPEQYAGIVEDLRSMGAAI